MSAHPVPTAALDDRLGILGTAGSGKTYAAGTMVERLLAKRQRVVITDPHASTGLMLQLGTYSGFLSISIFSTR